MGVRVRQKDGSWWVFIHHQGKRKAKKIGDRKAALEVKRKIEERLAARDLRISDENVIRYEDLRREIVRDYEVNDKRVSWLEDRLTYLDRAFAGLSVSEITTSAVREYTAKRRQEGAANATINRELSILRRMFNLASRATPPMVDRAPYIPMLREDNVRKGFFEWEEFERLRAELPEYLKPYATIAYYTGWRQQEILTLTWNQVDLHAGTVRLEPGTTKNREGRTIFLTGELLELFRRQKEVRDHLYRSCPWVIHRCGQRIRDFRAAWVGACRRAGLIGKIPHDFRRTAIRNMIRAGVPERVAMMISGHKTREVFDRYDIVSGADLLEAARKLERFVQERAVVHDLAEPLATHTQPSEPNFLK